MSAGTKGALAAMGFTYMTKIQDKSVAALLSGKDLLGAAKTGSGKTLAFLVPAVELLSKVQFTGRNGTGAVVISPTRELSLQIYGVLRELMAHAKHSGSCTTQAVGAPAAVSALELVALLKRFAGSGRAVAVTLHQPRVEIFSSFDRLWLLHRGQVAFSGSPLHGARFLKALGRSLNMQVIAEGVESAEQEAYITALGCNEGQGYYYSRPLSASAFDDWIRSYNTSRRQQATH